MKAQKALLAGLLVGLLDGMAAIINFMAKGGDHPARIFKFIASGVFGESAFAGGGEMVLAGIGFHFIIAIGWSLLFFLLYPKIRITWRNKYLFGILYGIFVWLMMQLLVLPLSSTPLLHSSSVDKLIGIGIHIVAVGMPITFVFHRYQE